VFVTADLFNLYVWLEVLLMASFVLLTLGGTRPQLRGGTVYVILSIVASALILAGIALVYGAVHALDFEVLRERLSSLATERPQLVRAIEAMLLVGLGIKAALFPLFFWLPVAYPTTAPSTAALFACLAGIGVFAMVRVVAGVFPADPVIQQILASVAAATMVTGCAAAVVQPRVRAMTSFLDVGHLGYLAAGLALASREALAALLYYLVHHLIATANLFLIAGAIRRARGHEELAGLGGLARERPLLAASFLVTGLSIAGVPPFSGFWAKLGILAPALEQARWLLAVAIVISGALTLIAFARLWGSAFAGRVAVRGPSSPERELVLLPIAALAALSLALGVAPEGLLALARDAADVLHGAAR
jgi:multicomponent Na+:H+ antiporter subunit D